jgi:hypothetical protein
MSLMVFHTFSEPDRHFTLKVDSDHGVFIGHS